MKENHRREFAEFLRDFAAGSSSNVDWQRFVVTHYPDEQLEDIRRSLVRLAIDQQGSKQLSDEDRKRLQSWACLLT
jgi:hypothetical protein